MSGPVFKSLLNNDFTAWQPQRSDDGRGGWLTTYTSEGTVRGRMRPRAGSEAEVADKEERQISHVLYIEATGTLNLAITRGWLITLGDFTAEVQGVRNPSMSFHHLEIDCRERQLEESEVLIGS